VCVTPLLDDDELLEPLDDEVAPLDDDPAVDPSSPPLVSVLEAGAAVPVPPYGPPRGSPAAPQAVTVLGPAATTSTHIILEKRLAKKCMEDSGL
jgi:hypothetical protein